MPSSPSLSYVALLLVGCTSFSGAEIDPPSGDAGTAGSMSGSSGQAGSLASGGAGQGGVTGGASGGAGLSGSGGQAGLAGMSGGASGGVAGMSGGASGDGGTSGTGGSSSGGNQTGGAAGSTGGAAGSTSGSAGTTSGAAGVAGSAGSSGSAGQGGSGGATCGDGVVQTGEECDDGQGNSSTAGGCSTACKKLCPTSPGGLSVKSGKTCYFSLGDDVSWDEAKTKCSNYGGKGHYALTSFESIDEFNAIKTQAIMYGIDGYWLGGHRVNGTLTWLTGSPISFTGGVPPWGKEEPEPSFDCVSIADTDFLAIDMATDSCNSTHVPLCEW